MCAIKSLLVTCRNYNIKSRLCFISVTTSMPDFDKVSEKDMSQLLPHKWKEYHPEAMKTTSTREIAKRELPNIITLATTYSGCS